MLNVYLLRHGQTEWNADGNRYCGRTDLPLTPTGTKQAELVYEQLKKISFDAVYSSPLQRAYQTALIAGGGKEVTKDDRLIEADFGNWEGKIKEQFISENRDLWNNWMANPLIAKAGGSGETAQEVIDRVEDFFRSLIFKTNNGNVLVVAHNGVNRLYLSYKLSMNVKNYRKLTLENSTISMFQLDTDGELTLVYLNSRF